MIHLHIHLDDQEHTGISLNITNQGDVITPEDSRTISEAILEAIAKTQTQLGSDVRKIWSTK